MVAQISNTAGSDDIGIQDLERRVCTNLKSFRQACGLSQKELAEKLNVSFQQVQKYENAINRISAGKLFELSKIFNIPVELFFSESPSEDFMHLVLRSAKPENKREWKAESDDETEILEKLKLLSDNRKKMTLKFINKISGL